MVFSPFAPSQAGQPARQSSPQTSSPTALVATRADDEVRHVALVGMPGAGKSSVGPLLAERLGCAFVDLDDAIAQAAQKSVAALFAEAGEVMFRAKERARLRELLARPEPLVIACGGGTWADAAMQRELTASARAVLLAAPVEVLLQRLEEGGNRSRRPLLHGPDPRAALERLWRAREPMHAVCPRQIDTAALQPPEVARRIAALLAREDEVAAASARREAPEEALAAAAPDVGGTEEGTVEAAEATYADGAIGETEATRALAPGGPADADADEFALVVDEAAGDDVSAEESTFLAAADAAPPTSTEAVAPTPAPTSAPFAAEAGAQSEAPAEFPPQAAQLRCEDDEDEAAMPLLLAPGLHASYPVYLLREGAPAVAACIDAVSTGNRVAVISDTGVAPQHAGRLLEALRARGLEVSLHVFAAGEENKRLATAHALYDELSDAGHGRGDLVVALGGGVVGDVAGFVASTYVRGVPFVQVPCSTLAAVDACIGSKTGLNTRRGKNLVGSLHDPAAVVVSLPYLGTQPPRVHAAGLVEALKVAALADAELFLAMQSAEALRKASVPEALGEVVGRALALKARFVGADVRENGDRALLNFGHTVGHAIEVGEDYSLLHGEAVGLGMVAEAEWAEANGLAHGVVEPLQQALRALGVPDDWRRARLSLDALTRDKKRRGESLLLPVVMPIGTARLHEVPIAELADFVGARARA